MPLNNTPKTYDMQNLLNVQYKSDLYNIKSLKKNINRHIKSMLTPARQDRLTINFHCNSGGRKNASMVTLILYH